jgi:hypothetical protein
VDSHLWRRTTFLAERVDLLPRLILDEGNAFASTGDARFVHGSRQ